MNVNMSRGFVAGGLLLLADYCLRDSRTEMVPPRPRSIGRSSTGGPLGGAEKKEGWQCPPVLNETVSDRRR